MTVQYSGNVSTASHLAVFYLVMCKWRGSVWKLVLWELIIWMVFVLILILIDYKYIHNSQVGAGYRELKEYVSVHGQFYSLLPFVLGFTSHFCFNRWFCIFNCLHWPNNIALYLNTFIRSSRLSLRTERRLRLTFARHLELAYILIFRDISVAIRRRFPTLEGLVDAKLLTEKELRMLKKCRLNDAACRYWIPIQWIVVRIREMRSPAGKTESLMSDYQSLEFFREIAALRSNLGDLLSFDWVPMPLSFLQIITWSVYVNMFIMALSVQHGVINVDGELEVEHGVWIGSMTALQLLLYLGWMKSVHVIINPFGEDDDDFEVNFLLDHHRAVLSQLIGEGASWLNDLPDDGVGQAPQHMHLPHTVGSMLLATKQKPMGVTGSAADEGEGKKMDPIQIIQV